MSRNLGEQFALLPYTLGNHVTLTVVSLGLGMLLSLPLAVYVVRRERLRTVVLGAAAVIQTMPGLALLALMVPLLAGLGALTSRTLGLEISALGFVPTVLALTLYSVLPMLRNTVTGIRGVDPECTEAAHALGMTSSQVLWKVELPLAAPIILAGIRTATVWVIGTATLATPVGQVCLGNHIFMGLQTRNWTAVLFGCAAAAALALMLDGLLGGLERAARHRSRKLALVCVAALALIIAGGVLAPRLATLARRPSVPWSTPDTGTGNAAARQTTGNLAGTAVDDTSGYPPTSLAPAADRAKARRRPVRIGTKTFTEQYILGDLIAVVLTANGFTTTRMDSLGSTIIFDALRHDEIDVYVDYSGTIWANHMERSGGGDRAAVLAEMTRWLQRQHGIVSLGSLGFENTYALAMRQDRAAALGLHSIDDLSTVAAGLVIGGDYEFFGRPEWRQLHDVYQLDFARQVSFDSTFMYDAVARGEVDVISAFSSDGRIEALDLVVLDDTRGVIPPYDAVVLLSPTAATRSALVTTLRTLVGTIDARTMRQANHRVDRDDNKNTVHEAALWLAHEIGVAPEPRLLR